MMFSLPSKTIQLGQPIDWAAPLNRGLEFWLYPLPQLSGNTGTVFDLTKTFRLTNTAALYTGVKQPGGVGSWVFDDQTATKLTTSQPETALLFGRTDITIAAWWNARTSGSANGRVFDSAPAIVYSVATDLGRAGWDNGANSLQTATNDVPHNTWHHIVCTADGTNKYIYVDGVQKATSAFSGNIAAPSVFTIGNRSTQGRVFDGWISDVRVYCRALSADETRDLYRASLQGYQRELNFVKRYWIGTAGAATSFKAAWASQRTQIIGGGVR